MDILEKYRVVQQSLTTTVNLGTIVSNGGIGTLKPGLDYFRFVLGTYDENDFSDTFAKDVTISNNHDWDYLYDVQNDYNKAYIYGDEANMYYPGNIVIPDYSSSGLQQTKEKFLNNFYYCIGTMDFTKKTESTLTDTEISYINSKYAWKKFNGTLKVPLGTEYKTYVWMIGSNVWGETNYEGYTEEACDDFDMPVIGNFSINSERINFCTAGTNVQDIVDVQGAYGSLYWGTYSDYWYKCPNFNIGKGSKDAEDDSGPRITFKGCKLKNADYLYLFNDSQPYCYAGLFDGSTITSGPKIGTGVINSETGRINLADYSCAQMFKSCKRLKEYQFDNRINISGESCLQGTFENCIALGSVVIPMMIYNGTTSGSGGGLTELDGGLSYNTMKGCFKNCSNLTKVELNLSPHGNKPTWWDYYWTNKMWNTYGYGLMTDQNAFINAGALSKINILNIKNIDNVIRKRTNTSGNNKYIYYLFGDQQQGSSDTDNSGADYVYTLINSFFFKGSYGNSDNSLGGNSFTKLNNDIKNIYVRTVDTKYDSLGIEINNWKLQINGYDYINSIRLPIINYSIDPTNYNNIFNGKTTIKFSLKFSNSLAINYVTFTVPKGITWAEVVDKNFGGNSLISIIYYNYPGYDSKYVGISKLESNTYENQTKSLIGFEGLNYAETDGDSNADTELGIFNKTIRFGAISPFQNGDPVDPNEEIQEHIYYINNTISNLESTKYASYGNLNWWQNPATPLVSPITE